ncbi:hypothetical protein [Streptomyces xylophagus]|uniref:hypothetical protein n=1 Tax=Streptomyces xylophagus TaxID=285514 RepID=UPI0005BB6889|nr:hypothetical protein [Streptomyces xylophagus]
MSLIPPSRETPLTPDFELDEDYESLVMDTCQLLAETDCRFHVAGFGQDPWPVDISYDLSSVMEQLPEAIASLGDGKPAQIDFYGQGVERLVTFAPHDGQVVITCTTETDWTPDPGTETVSSEEAKAALAALAHDFRRALDLVCPDISAVQPFTLW